GVDSPDDGNRVAAAGCGAQAGAAARARRHRRAAAPRRCGKGAERPAAGGLGVARPRAGAERHPHRSARDAVRVDARRPGTPVAVLAAVSTPGGAAVAVRDRGQTGVRPRSDPGPTLTPMTLAVLPSSPLFPLLAEPSAQSESWGQTGVRPRSDPNVYDAR